MSESLLTEVTGYESAWARAVWSAQIEIGKMLPVCDESSAISFAMLTGGMFSRRYVRFQDRTTPRWIA